MLKMNSFCKYENTFPWFVSRLVLIVNQLGSICYIKMVDQILGAYLWIVLFIIISIFVIYKNNS